MDADRKKKILHNGIGTIQYCREHEKYVEAELRAGRATEELLSLHEKKLSWVQHERLIHFLVTMLTAGALFFSFFMYIYVEGEGKVPALICSLVLLVLLFCYMVHYFHLENTVQLWYAYHDEIRDSIPKNN